MCSPCCELLGRISTPLEEWLFYYLLPESQHSASIVLVPLVAWNRAAVAGSVLPRKQFLYNLTFL